MFRKFKAIAPKKFINAAGKGDLATVQSYIKANQNNPTALNVTDNDGLTALMRAANNGHLAVVTTLLATRGINVNSTDKHKLTALIRAANNGHASVVNALLAVTGINVNASDLEGDTALMRAAIKGHEAIAASLLAMTGLDLTAKNNAGLTADKAAAKSGHHDIAHRIHFSAFNRGALAETIASAPSVGLNSDGSEEISHARFLEAAQNGELAVVQDYIAMNKNNIAAINQGNSNGTTALIFAAFKNHLAIVKTLLAVPGIKVNAGNVLSVKPLAVAAKEGHTDIVNALLATHDIDVNAAYKDGATALMCAASHGHDKIAAALIAAGSDVNALDESAENALLQAASHGRTTIVNALLAVHGIDVNAVDAYGRTALMRAAKNGHADVVSALLLGASNLNLDIKAEGDSAKTLALNAGHPAIHDMLAAAELARSVEIEVALAKKNLSQLTKLVTARQAAAPVTPAKLAPPSSPPSPPPTTPTFQERLDKIGYQGEIPEYMQCPISHEIMNDPITISTGHTYDRANLAKWLATHSTCPQTRKEINKSELNMLTTISIKNLIEAFVAAQELAYNNNHPPKAAPPPANIEQQAKKPDAEKILAASSRVFAPSSENEISIPPRKPSVTK